MQKTSAKQYGKAVIDYYGGEKSGKKSLVDKTRN
jgi:putative IMPACT (imprinted ancient) family translation regulator